MNKYQAALHYLISLSDDPLELGALRLYKALWFADVAAFQNTGKAISGAKYIKEELGPYPVGVRDQLQDLVRRRMIRIRDPEDKYLPRMFLCLREPQDDLLSEDERARLREASRFVLTKSTNEISEQTHTLIWDIADEREEIPLVATLADRPKGTACEPSEEVEEWARERIAEIQAGGNAHH